MYIAFLFSRLYDKNINLISCSEFAIIYIQLEICMKDYQFWLLTAFMCVIELADNVAVSLICIVGLIMCIVTYGVEKNSS